MSDDDLKARLLKPRLDEGKVAVPGIGEVRIRALSREESLLLHDQKTVLLQERFILRYGVIDPELSFQEVEKWQKASPAGELEAVTTAISRLSGMSEEAERETTARFHGDAGPPV